MKYARTLAALLLTALLIGCAGLYSHIVTLTEVRDSAMKELALMSKQGRITAATDAKIAKADEVYRQSAETAAVALKMYRDGIGTQNNSIAALQAAKTALTGLLDILAQFIPASETTKYRTQVAKATKI